jgi:hypothetical protein
MAEKRWFEDRGFEEKKIEGLLDEVKKYRENVQSKEATRTLREALDYARKYDGPKRGRYQRRIYKEARLIGRNEPPDSKWDDVEWECGPLQIEEEVRDLICSRTPLRHPFRNRNLSLAIIGAIGLIAGLFFLSSNMTGNVIRLNVLHSNILGGVLFILGLVAVFFGLNLNKKKL